MKFKFPLQKVLDHRKIKEDLAQKDFQEAQMAVLELKQKKSEMEQAIHDAHLRTGLLHNEGGNKGPELSQINDFIRFQKILIEKLQAKIVYHEKIVEEKRELLRQAAIETKIIAKFKEKKFEEYQKERDAEEQKEMDEQSILRYKPASKY